MRIFYTCPDTQQALGGVKVIYRHIEILQEAGFDAYVLHSIKGFSCNWFEHRAKIAYVEDIRFQESDYLVLPENAVVAQLLKPISNYEKIFRKLFNKYKYKHFIIEAWHLPCKKVLFNQNAYYSFDAWPSVEYSLRKKLYAPLKAVTCVSEDNKAYLQAAFPESQISLIPVSVGYIEEFAQQEKLNKIGYMPRKNAAHIKLVQGLLNLPNNWQWEEIAHLNAEEAVKKMATCKVFAAFGHPEGLQLPPLEAMAHRTLVVGYHGEGCKHLLNETNAFPIDFGAFQSFAQTLEMVINSLDSDVNAFDEKIKNAQKEVLAYHSKERETLALLNFWRAI